MALQVVNQFFNFAKRATLIICNSDLTVSIYFITLLILRSPDISRVRAKMLYATSKERFRHELDGVHYEIQATEPSEMDLQVLVDRAN